MAPVDLSLIIPIHNEEKILKENIRLLYEYLTENKSVKKFEIIIIDNGSSDKSQKYTKDIFFSFSAIKAFFIKEKEIGSAIKKGIQNAKFEHLLFYAVDLPFGLEIIEASIKEIEGANFIIGSKRHPLSKTKIPLLRKTFSIFYNIQIQILFGLKVLDTQGSVLFKKSVVGKYIHLMNSKNAWFETQLILYGNLFGAKIKEIPVNYIARKDSKMKIQDGLILLADLLKEYPRYRIYKKIKNENRKK